jgi:hypothetical protein
MPSIWADCLDCKKNFLQAGIYKKEEADPYCTECEKKRAEMNAVYDDLGPDLTRKELLEVGCRHNFGVSAEDGPQLTIQTCQICGHTEII